MPVKVSIFMLTYNQQDFISQAIEGVLMQDVDFDYQLVIGEDKSDDNTLDICKFYASKFPEKILLLPCEDANLGFSRNYIRTLKACNGKYIAICDGDDYWTDNQKLKKQVHFLETNPQYSIVFAKTKKLFPDGIIKALEKASSQKDYTFEDIVFDNPISSVTVLFENFQNNYNKIPEWFEGLPYADWPTFLWILSHKNKAYMLDEFTSVYRMNIGLSHKLRNNLSDVALIKIKILKFIFSDKKFDSYKSVVKKSIYKAKSDLMLSYNRENQFLASFKILISLMFNNKDYKALRVYFYSIKKRFTN